jgi:hypothetical protein
MGFNILMSVTHNQNTYYDFFGGLFGCWIFMKEAMKNLFLLSFVVCQIAITTSLRGKLPSILGEGVEEEEECHFLQGWHKWRVCLLKTPPQGPHDNERKYKNYIPSLEGGLYRKKGGDEGCRKIKWRGGTFWNIDYIKVGTRVFEFLNTYWMQLLLAL